MQERRKQVGAHGVWDTIIAGWIDDRHVGKSPGMGEQRSSWMPTLSLSIFTIFSSSLFKPIAQLTVSQQSSAHLGALYKATSFSNSSFHGWWNVLTVALAVVSKSKGDGNEPKRHVSGTLRGTITNDVSSKGESKDGLLPEFGTDRGRKGVKNPIS